MKEIKRILFPIDFAEDFESLLPWISTFVSSFNATLCVLYVAQPLADYSSFCVSHGNLQQFQEEALKAAEKKMSATAREQFKAFKNVEALVAQGSPAEKIIETAKTAGIDLIVMGTHGRKGLELAIFGSVCDKVVRTAPCPVLTINPAHFKDVFGERARDLGA
jgi:nucleotide-binding universal stress UspA family protein